MANLAFHLEVLRLATKQLKALKDGRAALLESNWPFAVLGAMGPDLLEHLPAGKQLVDDLDGLAKKKGSLKDLSTASQKELFQRPMMAIYALVFRRLVVPFWPLFRQVTDFLDKMDGIAQAEDGDKLKAAKDEVTTMQTTVGGLKGLTTAVDDLKDVIGQILALPPWIELTKLPWAPQGNRLFEFLRWHHTGDFARNLMKLASNDQQRAYALGYLCHVAASVTGEPFINNIAGGPYRTHWWRHRLVGNFVDTWTFGFFESAAHMSGDTPSPAYDAWKPLCSANVQDQFNVGGLAGAAAPGQVPAALAAVAAGDLGALPAQFPADLAAYLQSAVDATHAVASRPEGFGKEAFQQAYVGAFSVFWFMTSGSGPMCDNPIGAPPSSCTSAPGWVTGGGSPPSPQKSGPSTAGAVSAIVLAILAILAFLTQNYAAGVAAILGAIAALESDGDVDWDQLRCNLFWLRKELVDAENAIRDLLVTGALAYPPPGKLGTVDASGQTHPAVDKTPPSGMPLCRTHPTVTAVLGAMGGAMYPLQMDATVPPPPATGLPDLDFSSFPQAAAETPLTMDFPNPGVYPDFVVNGAGLQNGGVLVDGTYPSRNQFFGDAVSNAVAVVQNEGKDLPGYNLDADRGYGWKSWNPKAGSTPRNPPVIDVQEV
jgi:hypothetical protein